MLLRWPSAKFNDDKVIHAAHLVENAIKATVVTGITIKDLSGTAGTSDVADAVASPPHYRHARITKPPRRGQFGLCTA